MSIAWVDATAGIAGDMLLGALLDAGADLAVVQAAVAAVVPGEVAVDARAVHRAGLRATRAEVTSTAADHPHRAWPDIRTLLGEAPLSPEVREKATSVFARLADAEAHVHGVDAEDVEFHEVGSWDSIADIVGVCAAVADLRVTDLTVGPVALGSGRIAAAHGDLPVPGPAVLHLALGWTVLPGGPGEWTTPTGMALVRGLAARCGPLPPMVVNAAGMGAGSRDPADHANVTRVVLGTPLVGPTNGDPAAADTAAGGTAAMTVLETNVDDLDPRVWPTVLAALLDAGAADAWLVPILMKKGRPAHTLCVLAAQEKRAAIRTAMFALTSTLGVRETAVQRTALGRDWLPIALADGRVRVKVGLRDGVVSVVNPEFDDAAALAAVRGVPVRHVLDEALAEAAARGVRPGAHWH
ncbi:MAG TPA: nickel pincer cofactor biosynthesis protein LarC [Pseudonocardia sp.]